MWLKTEKKIKIVRFNDSQVRIRFQVNKITNFVSINVNFANDRFIEISNVCNFSFKKMFHLNKSFISFRMKFVQSLTSVANNRSVSSLHDFFEQIFVRNTINLPF